MLAYRDGVGWGDRLFEIQDPPGGVEVRMKDLFQFRA